MKINYYDYFFYNLYKRYLKKYREVNSWQRLFIILTISVIEGMPLYVLVLMFFRFQSLVIQETYVQFGVLGLLCFINWKYFLADERWITIIEKYKVYDNSKISKRMNIITWIIIAICFLSIFYWQAVIEWKLFFY